MIVFSEEKKYKDIKVSDNGTKCEMTTPRFIWCSILLNKIFYKMSGKHILKIQSFNCDEKAKSCGYMFMAGIVDPGYKYYEDAIVDAFHLPFLFCPKMYSDHGEVIITNDGGIVQITIDCGEKAAVHFEIDGKSYYIKNAQYPFEFGFSLIGRTRWHKFVRHTIKILESKFVPYS
jgi:hypothetical protein